MNTAARREDDKGQILSGVFEGRATGTPIALLIRDTDQRSEDYSKTENLFRPGHADYTYQLKYGIRDYRGGGRSSSRETAGAGGGRRACQQILETAFRHRDSWLSRPAWPDSCRKT